MKTKLFILLFSAFCFAAFTPASIACGGKNKADCHCHHCDHKDGVKCMKCKGKHMHHHKHMKKHHAQNEMKSADPAPATEAI